MVKFSDEVKNKQLEIMSLLFNINKEIDNEYEAHNLINNAMKELRQIYNLENFKIDVFVKDDDKSKWKQGTSKPNLFLKVFFNELDYVEKSMNLSKSETNFLFSLGRHLLWQKNLVVDSNGEPANQKMLCKILNMDRKTVYKLAKSLENKKCLIRIWSGRETYYVVNPYIMFVGSNINKDMVKLFDIIGYIPLKNSKNNKRLE